MATASSRPIAKRRTTLIGEHETCSAGSMDDIYEPGDVIGTGSFGIIRKVIRKADGVVLARKELNYGRMDERDLKQLTEEVNILEQLGFNDNIVRYHERFVDKPNNMLYILMEYCEGGDLAGVINRCRKTGTLLSEDVVWAYLAQITLALYDCHTEMDETGRRKVVILHRDIKPENVFLDKDNNLKLGDFGLSKAMAQAAMTQTYVGTPYYMSPELINGQPYDVKSDIWALGCLIYELCAGHPPFHEARTQPELAVMIREGKIPDLPKAYTPHLGQVVKAMLKQSPKHRPTTSQIKALDNVKLQIRAIELRKATKELRLRDQQIAVRETDLLLREASVLAREKAVTAKEIRMRAASEDLREAQARANAVLEDRENMSPDGDLLARIASRPSMVPRRPLEDRRGSSGNTTSIPFPRLPSSSSLMSLDTPLKSVPNSTRRRLASKSMFDLASAGGFPLSTPSRTISGVSLEPGQRALNNLNADSPSFRAGGGGGATGTPMTNRTGMGRSYGHVEMVASPAPFRPIAPSRTSTAPPSIPTSSYDSPSSNNNNPQYEHDDMPSPFLKKGDGLSRVAISNQISKAAGGGGGVVGGRPPVRSTRMSLGSKFLGARKLLS